MTPRPTQKPRFIYELDDNGCHIWQRAKNSKGYGVLWHEGKAHLAHRVQWLYTHGAWPPKGLVVDHICNQPACINPDHLRLLDNGANIRRAYPRGDERTEHQRAIWRRSSAARRARKAAAK